jgi:hypothetical protein
MHLNNLFLAGIWIVLGLSLIVQDRVVHGDKPWDFSSTNMLFAWLALAMAGYNMVRWRFRRKSSRAELDRTDSRRRADLARRDRDFQESGRERDPNFIFDDPPKPGAL